VFILHFVGAKDDGGDGDNLMCVGDGGILTGAITSSQIVTVNKPIIFTGQMSFLSPNQQCPSTEENRYCY